MTLNLDSTTGGYTDAEEKYEDTYVSIPFIQLYDDNVYTYRFTKKADGSFDGVEMWYDVHESKPQNRWK